MKNQISNRIYLVLLGAMFVTVCTIVTVVVWMSFEHNRKSAEDSLVMITGGLDAVDHSLELITIDYSWWETALEKIQQNDLEWVTANMGSGVVESQSMDLLVISSAEGKPLYGWSTQDESSESRTDYLTEDQIASLLKLLPSNDDDAYGVQTRFMMINDKLFLLSVAHVLPPDLSAVDLEKTPVNIVGFLFHPQRVEEIGSAFLTSDLAVSPVIEDGKLFVPIQNAGGDTFAYFTWTPPTPGKDLLNRSLWPISIALLLFIGIGIIFAVGSRRASSRLADKVTENFENARRDDLTGLPNRICFSENIDSPASRAASARGELGVISLDVDRFKHINETFGRSAGDALLRGVAQRLSAILPHGAYLARVGVDEFNVVVAGKDVSQLVEKTSLLCVQATQQDFDVLGEKVIIAVSVGYASSQEGNASCEELVRRADVAMQEAKVKKAGAPIVYQESYEAQLLKNKLMEDALRSALEKDELDVHYQPIVNALTGEMELVEALVRWESKVLGSVSPVTFITVAEETGLIGALGRYVFRRACKDMLGWPGLKVSINLSPIQLRDPLLKDSLVGIANEIGIKTDRIEFELTEGIAVSHPGVAKQRLNELKDAGFAISLDDFGTGFSSLGYLRQLPFDKMKIDRSFISNLEADTSAVKLMQSIAGVGNALDLKVVAEGVETGGQLTLVQAAGCDQIQGYYFSKPLSFDALCEWHTKNEQKRQNVSA